MITLIILCMVIFHMSVHYLYYKITKFTKTITVVKKYIRTLNGLEYYFLYDTNHDLFVVDICLWQLNFSYRNLWTNISEGKQYKVEVYGCNIPYLNIYQNITKADSCE